MSTKIIDNIQKVNPRYKDFFDAGSNKEELLVKHSVSTHKSEESKHPMASVALDKNYHAFMYANVDYDKAKRLRDYRVMAQFAEVADALDEICDDCLNLDDKQKSVRLELKDPELDSTISKDLRLRNFSSDIIKLSDKNFNPILRSQIQNSISYNDREIDTSIARVIRIGNYEAYTFTTIKEEGYDETQLENIIYIELKHWKLP